MTTRRRALLAAAAAPWLAAGASAAAFPQRPITLWVPWAAGGATDQTLRLLAELAGRQLGQKVLVENRGGAGGTLAMPVLQQAAPDGHTIAQMPQPVFRAPHTQKLQWDPIRDTTPIIQVSGVTFGVLVPAHSELGSIDDLLRYAAARPGE
jgi:tripartite-type tricarboxylate transporter receptor subunit TctC